MNTVIPIRRDYRVYRVNVAGVDVLRHIYRDREARVVLDRGDPCRDPVRVLAAVRAQEIKAGASKGET